MSDVFIQDSLDKRIAPKAGLYIKTNRNGLFYRVFDERGWMVRNGFIEGEHLIKLRDLINEVLGDSEPVFMECDTCKVLTGQYNAAAANNLWQTARAKDRQLVAHEQSHATGPSTGE